MAYVACGRYDGFWEEGLNPWDVAAGKLLIEEAGGEITYYDGSPFSIYTPPLCAATAASIPRCSMCLSYRGKRGSGGCCIGRPNVLIN